MVAMTVMIQIVLTWMVMSSAGMSELMAWKPEFSWRVPSPRLVQTPNRVVRMERTSMRSPIQPKMRSPWDRCYESGVNVMITIFGAYEQF
jgi:hypothetical protein